MFNRLDSMNASQSLLVRLIAAIIALASCSFGPQAQATGCNVAASQGAGGPADWAQYCWMDFSAYNSTTARSASGQTLSFTLPDGSTVTFNIKATAGSSAQPTPTWGGAPVGNSGFIGIPGRPSLYGGGTESFTFSAFTVTPPADQSVAPNIRLVFTDGEGTRAGETVFGITNGSAWTTIGQIAPFNGTGTFPTLSGAGTQNVSFTNASGNPGAYIFETKNFSQLDFGYTANSRQGMIFGIYIPTVVPIVATSDSISGINGVAGTTTALNVFAGDTLGGAAATTSNAVLSVASGSSVPAGLTFNAATGSVGVTAGTAAGTYTFKYLICEAGNSTNCKVADATVTVSPSVDFSISKTNGVTEVNPGSTTTYVVTVTNNRPDAALGAVVKDIPGPGITCPAANTVTIAGDGVPAGSFTFADLTGSGITLGALANGQSTTLTYACQVN
ncbi:hypothetical protein GCM10023115_23890 [Pontixanthobacter gangjinensis]|uniref:DUF11 domain-containing protein n=1 Tax=Pontixanthobacter gangjinensis TaxID=1028742 RepID=A0A6I4SPE5_9SPHN|nr:DUF11 domain-containing protein [Pontixanthobacter gangjinensis]MXO57634.1 DUF11 domain-containing protein [Pontixanthobacter gangjinensis]